MAVIAFTSAKGAPGVTTTALGVALCWPRPVLLLEADLSGSSSILAGYLSGQVRHDRGLIDLAIAHRDADLPRQLSASAIPLPDSQVHLIPALTSPSQAPSMAPVWDPLLPALAALQDHGMDVIVDAGRINTIAAPTPLLRHANLTLLVTRTTLPAAVAAKAATTTLVADLESRHLDASHIQLVTVGEGQPYTGRELTKVTGRPVAASIASDPVNAEVYALGVRPGRSFTTSNLYRSMTAAASRLSRQVLHHVIDLRAQEAVDA